MRAAFVRIRGDHAKLRQFQRAQVDRPLGELSAQRITLAAGQAPACEQICFEVAKLREPLFRQADAGDTAALIAKEMIDIVPAFALLADPIFHGDADIVEKDFIDRQRVVWERVHQYVYISMVAGYLKKK